VKDTIYSSPEDSFDLLPVRSEIFALMTSMPFMEHFDCLKDCSPEAQGEALNNLRASLRQSSQGCIRIIHQNAESSLVGEHYGIEIASFWNSIVDRGSMAPESDLATIKEFWSDLIATSLLGKIAEFNGILPSMPSGLWTGADDFCDQFIRMSHSDIRCGILHPKQHELLKIDISGVPTWPILSDWRLKFVQDASPFALKHLEVEDIPGPLFA
jgi:hypothetical protein